MHNCVAEADMGSGGALESALLSLVSPGECDRIFEGATFFSVRAQGCQARLRSLRQRM